MSWIVVLGSVVMLQALLGGVLIGAAATLYWFINGRVAGISGVVSGALRDRGDRSDRVLFLAGLVAAGVVAAFARGGAAPTGQSALPLIVAGALVGFGTRLGGGCTSGHGVCGLARVRKRSLVATITFIAFGAATVFVVSRVAPGWSVR